VQNLSVLEIHKAFVMDHTLGSRPLIMEARIRSQVDKLALIQIFLLNISVFFF